MIFTDFEEKFSRFHAKNIQIYKNAVAFAFDLMYNKM